MKESDTIERWALVPSELWAVVRTEADSRVVAAVCDDEAIAWATAVAKDEDGSDLIDEATVLPCFVVGGEVVIANDCEVKTHEQLRAALALDPGEMQARCPVHDMQEHGREAAELCEGIERIVAGADDDDEVPADELRKLLDSVDARDSLAYLERKGRTPWNPPGTPYPPAQDGATLLVWSMTSQPGVGAVFTFPADNGEWRVFLGSVSMSDPTLQYRYPQPGCPWLLIPDPEQGR